MPVLHDTLSETAERPKSRSPKLVCALLELNRTVSGQTEYNRLPSTPSRIWKCERNGVGKECSLNAK